MAVAKGETSSISCLLEEFSSWECGYPIEYNGFLSNHLTHGVVALTAVYEGHEEQAAIVRSFAEDYLKDRPDLTDSKEDRSDKKGSEISSLIPEWKDMLKSDMLGQMKDFPDLMTRVGSDLITQFENDINALVQSKYPDTLAGLSGAALHPLIHLGFAVFAQNKAMVIEGLAYSVFGYRQLWDDCASSAAAIGSSSSESSAIIKPCSELSDAYSLLCSLKTIFEEYSVRDSIIELVSVDKPRWREQLKKEGRFQLSALILGKSSLVKSIVDAHVSALLATLEEYITMDDECTALSRSVMSLSLGAYNAVSDNDFFVLHCVTSAFALCQISKLMISKEIRKEMLRRYLEAVCVFYMALGCPDLTHPKDLKLDSMSESEVDFEVWLPNVKETLAKEMKSGVFRDEHCYKLLFVCVECIRHDLITSLESTESYPSPGFQAVYAVEKSLNKPFTFGGFVNAEVLED